MGAKLGTLLVREGVISPQQLEEALRIQVIYGGRLGTNLVEMGVVDVDVMGEWLGRVTGFPVATQQLFEEAPADVVSLLPAELAERFECFPLRKDNRRLHLAMVNPTDLAATDALSFKTGLRIVPYVVPELRLYFYLEKKYGLVRKLRYIRLSPREEASVRASPAQALPPPPNFHVAEQAAAYERTQGISVPGGSAPGPSTGQTSPRGLVPPPPRPAAPPSNPPALRSQPTPITSPRLPAGFGTPPLPSAHSTNPGTSAPTGWSAPPPAAPVRPAAPPAWAPPAPRSDVRPAPPMPSQPRPSDALGRTTQPGGFTPPPHAPPPTPRVAPLSLADAVASLESAPGREEIAEVILRFGLGLLDSVLLFLVRDGMALGWRGRGENTDPAVVELVMLPLNAPSMFQEAVDSKKPVGGQVSDLVLHRHFFKALRREQPASALVVPIIMRERAVNLVYGDLQTKGDATYAAAQLVELGQHVAVAYERIVRDAKRRGV